jgi:hypothetical protein
MRMLISLEFADAGVMTGTHKVLVVGGCSVSTAPGDIGMSLEEAKALLMAIQWEFVAAQSAEIVENARVCGKCGSTLNIKDWKRRGVHTLFGHVLLQSPRVISCACSGNAARAITPLKGWLARTSQGNCCIKGVEIGCLRLKTWSGRLIRRLATSLSATRVLDPRFALVTRSCDIGHAQTRIVSCVSDGQARSQPR